MGNLAIYNIDALDLLSNYSGKLATRCVIRELTFAEVEEVLGGNLANGTVSGFGYTLSNGGNWANTFYQTAVWVGGGAIAGSFGGLAGAGIGALGGALAGFGGSFTLHHIK